MEVCAKDSNKCPDNWLFSAVFNMYMCVACNAILNKPVLNISWLYIANLRNDTIALLQASVHLKSAVLAWTRLFI